MTFNYNDITSEHYAACIKWATKMSATTEWNLTSNEMAALLNMDTAEYIEIQKKADEGIPFSLRNESTERISLLLRISKRLHLLGLDEQTSISLFKKANNGNLLKGKSIRQFLLESNSVASFYAVALYLESSTGN